MLFWFFFIFIFSIRKIKLRINFTYFLCDSIPFPRIKKWYTIGFIHSNPFSFAEHVWKRGKESRKILLSAFRQRGNSWGIAKSGHRRATSSRASRRVAWRGHASRFQTPGRRRDATRRTGCRGARMGACYQPRHSIRARRRDVSAGNRRQLGEPRRRPRAAFRPRRHSGSRRRRRRLLWQSIPAVGVRDARGHLSALSALSAHGGTARGFERWRGVGSVDRHHESRRGRSQKRTGRCRRPSWTKQLWRISASICGYRRCSRTSTTVSDRGGWDSWIFREKKGNGLNSRGRERGRRERRREIRDARLKASDAAATSIAFRDRDGKILWKAGGRGKRESVLCKKKKWGKSGTTPTGHVRERGREARRSTTRFLVS